MSRTDTSPAPARTAYAGSYVLRDIPPALHRAAKIRAAERGESLRAVLLRLLRQYVDEGATAAR